MIKIKYIPKTDHGKQMSQKKPIYFSWFTIETFTMSVLNVNIVLFLLLLFITEQCRHYGKLYPIREYVHIPDMRADTCSPMFTENCEVTYDHCDGRPYFQK